MIELIIGFEIKRKHSSLTLLSASRFVFGEINLPDNVATSIQYKTTNDKGNLITTVDYREFLESLMQPFSIGLSVRYIRYNEIGVHVGSTTLLKQNHPSDETKKVLMGETFVLNGLTSIQVSEGNNCETPLSRIFYHFEVITTIDPPKRELNFNSTQMPLIRQL